MWSFSFFFQAEDGIRDHCVTGVQTCALPIYPKPYGCSCSVGSVPTGGSVGSEPFVSGGSATTSSDPSGRRLRSEERRVGKEGRARGGRDDSKKKENKVNDEAQRQRDEVT